MYIISEYIEHFNAKNGAYTISAKKEHPCPLCGGALKFRSVKKRKVVMLDGTEKKLRLRHMKCQDCGKMHVELPDYVFLRRHYDAVAVGKVLSGEITNKEYFAVSSRTIQRWIKKSKEEMR